MRSYERSSKPENEASGLVYAVRLDEDNSDREWVHRSNGGMIIGGGEAHGIMNNKMDSASKIKVVEIDMTTDRFG